jgi:peptide/nickel transport system permease protein
MRAKSRPLPGRLNVRGTRLGGATILGLIITCCFVIPIISPYGPDSFVGKTLQPPTISHPFGTDLFGRDVFTRVFAGGRVDILVAAIGVSVPLIIGTMAGVASGMTRFRWIDAIFVRVIDAVIAFPFIILVLVLVVAFGAQNSWGPFPPGVPALLGAVFIIDWTVYSRLARASVLTLRQRDFIVAARLLGYSSLRIAFRHLLPNVFGTTATYAISDAVLVLVATASLPFLGAGVQPPNPEWGSIMYDGRTVLASAWWITLAPGLLLVTFGIGITLVADSLIDRRAG